MHQPKNMFTQFFYKVNENLTRIQLVYHRSTIHSWTTRSTIHWILPLRALPLHPHKQARPYVENRAAQSTLALCHRVHLKTTQRFNSPNASSSKEAKAEVTWFGSAVDRKPQWQSDRSWIRYRNCICHSAVALVHLHRRSKLCRTSSQKPNKTKVIVIVEVVFRVCV